MDQDTEEFSWVVFLEKLFVLAFNDLDVEVSGFGFNDCLSGNEDVFINKKLGSVPLMEVISHVKSFSTCTCLIKKGGVADLKSGQLLNDSLIVKK